MEEHESDILIAEKDEETLDDTFKSEEKSDQNWTDTMPQQMSEQNTENKTIKKETDAFVNYNFNNLNKVYKKYDVVQTYVPKKQPETKKNKEFETFVTGQTSYVPEKETFSVERVSEKPKFKLKNKAKVWLVAFCAIFCMVGGLAIYNGVHISQLQSEISQSGAGLTDLNKQIETIIKDIGKLTDDDTIKDEAGDLGLGEATDANKVSIKLEDKKEVKDYQKQTNFFDKICNFFRNLFGG